MSALGQQPESAQFQSALSKTGSPGGSEPVFLVVGKLRRPHGLLGEIIMEVMTDFPERLSPELQLFIGPDHIPIHILRHRQHQNMLLVTLEGYSSRDTVGNLRNQNLYVDAAEIPSLPEGEYYHHQLLGLKVFSDQGEHLGVITEIIETGANDVLIVRTPLGPDILIPYLEALVIKVDLELRELHTRLLPGLLPDE